MAVRSITSSMSSNASSRPRRPERTQLGPAIVKGSFVDGNGRKQLHGPAAGRGRPSGVGGGARRAGTAAARHSAAESAITALAASASPTALRVGDPLTLTLDIERGAEPADRST